MVCDQIAEGSEARQRTFDGNLWAAKSQSAKEEDTYFSVIDLVWAQGDLGRWEVVVP